MIQHKLRDCNAPNNGVENKQSSEVSDDRMIALFTSKERNSAYMGDKIFNEDI